MKKKAEHKSKGHDSSKPKDLAEGAPLMIEDPSCEGMLLLVIAHTGEVVQYGVVRDGQYVTITREEYDRLKAERAGS